MPKFEVYLLYIVQLFAIHVLLALNQEAILLDTTVGGWVL